MKQGTKFSKETQTAKLNIRLIRMQAGHTVREGAAKLGLTTKHMESVETSRNYGCFLSLDFLVKVAKVYRVSIDRLVFGEEGH